MPSSSRLRLALVFLLAVLTTGLYTLPSSAASFTRSGTVLGVPAGYGDGYNDVIGTTGVFSHLMSISGHQVYVYCLVQSLPYKSTGYYQASMTPQVQVNNLSHALYIAASSSKMGTPLTVTNEEAVAVQLAIWNETSNFNIYQVNNSTIDARAAQLVSLASAGSIPAPQTGANLRANEIPTTSGARVTLTLTTPAGQPLRSAGISVTSPFTRHLTTNQQGQITFFVPARHVLRASYTGTLEAGTVMVASPADQPLVTTAPVLFTKSVALSVRGLAPPATTLPTRHPSTPTTTRQVAPTPPTTIHRPTPPSTIHRPTPPTTLTPTTVTNSPTTSTPPATPQPTSSGPSKGFPYWLVIVALILLALLVLLRPRRRKMR